jgi:hypothetical protein
MGQIRLELTHTKSIIGYHLIEKNYGIGLATLDLSLVSDFHIISIYHSGISTFSPEVEGC